MKFGIYCQRKDSSQNGTWFGCAIATPGNLYDTYEAAQTAAINHQKTMVFPDVWIFDIREVKS